MQENATKNKTKCRAQREQRGIRIGSYDRLRAVLRHVGMAVIGCLFGRAEMLFGTYPLGVSLLCVSGKYTGAVLAGTLVSVFLGTEDPMVHLCTYVAVALLRVVGVMILEAPDEPLELGARLLRRLRLITATDVTEPTNKEDEAEPEATIDASDDTFDEVCDDTFDEVCDDTPHALSARDSNVWKILLAGVGALIIGLYRMIAGGFRYYDLFALLFLLVFCPVVALVFRYRIEREETETSLPILFSEAALLLAIVWSVRGGTLFGWSVGAMVALLLSLYCCAHRNVALGIGAAILCGVAYHPLYAPAYGMAALVFFMMKRLGRERAGILFGCFASLFWFVYIGGADALVRYLPACLFVGAVMTVCRNIERHFENKRKENDAVSSVGNAVRFADLRHRDSKELLRGISDALSGLSEMFYNLSNRFRRPGTLDLRRICDRSMDRFCTDCPNRKVCWGVEYGKTLETVNHLISALHTKGRVEESLFPKHWQHRCASVGAIVEEINRECARVTYEMLCNDRDEIFAMDYEAAASIINDALEEDEEEYRPDAELEQKVAEYLCDAGVLHHSVTVCGKRRRQIVVRGAQIENATVSARTMCSDLGEMCGILLSNPLFEVEDGVSTMILRAEKCYSVEGAQNNVSADGGVSGDTLTLFSNQRDYFYALINDGMGAGREAALTSNLCSVFLEKMLRAGNRATTSLRMLNNMIRSRAADSAGETSSTVDLLELDLMTGDAAFIKSGAAPSFVVRKDTVHRIQAGTAPIGIIQTLDAQKTAFRLRAGDTVVMISDGILQNDPEGTWLRAYLAGAGQLTPDEIVYHICLHAASCDVHDDCSALALRIGDVEEER